MQGRSPASSYAKAHWIGTPERLTVKTWLEFKAAQDGRQAPPLGSDEFLAQLRSNMAEGLQLDSADSGSAELLVANAESDSD